MRFIYIDLPESVLLATGQSQAEFVKEAKFLLALKLFELGRLSSGKAADLCALPRVDFLLLAGRAGVPVVDLDHWLTRTHGDDYSKDLPQRQ
jgi:predicted HTH domain antitoxin